MITVGRVISFRKVAEKNLLGKEWVAERAVFYIISTA
jgi:hypothetical protein